MRKLKCLLARVAVFCLCGIGIICLYHVYPSKRIKTCEVFDTRLPARKDLECVKVKLTQPDTVICIYDVKVDRYVSGSILKKGAYEVKELKLVQSWFRQDPELGLIDIGTNIGMYSLTMATMGHKVVSVEPGTRHLTRLNRSVELGNLHDRITVLRNAVGDKRGNAKMVYGKPDNQGTSSVALLNDTELLAKKPIAPKLHVDKNSSDTTEEYVQTIWLNDILPFCGFSKAVIKMDIEGHEHEAFAHCEQLFKKIKITYIIMEWYIAVERIKPLPNGRDRALFNHMLDFFVANGYQPYGLNKEGSLHKLGMTTWFTKWPNIVVWHLER